MFIIIIGDVVDRTSPIIYNRWCSTNVYTTEKIRNLKEINYHGKNL